MNKNEIFVTLSNESCKFHHFSFVRLLLAILVRSDVNIAIQNYSLYYSLSLAQQWNELTRIQNEVLALHCTMYADDLENTNLNFADELPMNKIDIYE